MKQIDIYIKEAFITKANIADIRKKQKSNFPDTVGGQLLNDVYSSIDDDNAAKFTSVLKKNNLLPQENIVKGKNIVAQYPNLFVDFRDINDEKYYVICTQVIYRTITKRRNGKVTNGQLVTSVPICKITPNSMIVPDENIISRLNDIDESINLRNVINRIFNVCEPIAEFLDIDICDMSDKIGI